MDASSNHEPVSRWVGGEVGSWLAGYLLSRSLRFLTERREVEGSKTMILLLVPRLWVRVEGVIVKARWRENCAGPTGDSEPGAVDIADVGDVG